MWTPWSGPMCVCASKLSASTWPPRTPRRAVGPPLDRHDNALSAGGARSAARGRCGPKQDCVVSFSMRRSHPSGAPGQTPTQDATVLPSALGVAVHLRTRRRLQAIAWPLQPWTAGTIARGPPKKSRRPKHSSSAQRVLARSGPETSKQRPPEGILTKYAWYNRLGVGPAKAALSAAEMFPCRVLFFLSCVLPLSCRSLYNLFLS